MNAHSHAGTYARIGLETRAMSANPMERVVMLYDGAHSAIEAARAHLAAGRTEEKCVAVSKALRIIEEGLRPSVDPDRGGELALQLDSLYDYIGRRLLLGQVRNDDAMMAEAGHLLADLGSAWREVATREAE